LGQGDHKSSTDRPGLVNGSSDVRNNFDGEIIKTSSGVGSLYTDEVLPGRRTIEVTGGHRPYQK
jgi:hypothetical protein